MNEDERAAVLRAIAAIDAGNRAAVLRVIAASELGKHPAAADLRVAAGVLRMVLGSPKATAKARKPGRPGFAGKSYRDALKSTELAATLALARHVRGRAPTEADFKSVGKQYEKPSDTIRYHWGQLPGRMARRQVETEVALAALAPTLEEIYDWFGDAFGSLTIDAQLNSLIERWQGATFQEREAVEKIFRGIIAEKGST